MNSKTVPPQFFLCVAEDVTQEQIPAFAQRAIDPLDKALAAVNLQPAGDLQFICEKWNGEKPSRLIIGIPILQEPATPAAAPYFVWKSPAFKCAWLDHKGPMPSLKEAWANFGPAVAAAGLMPAPTHAWREIYKHFESFDSPNDLTELQLEIL